MADTTVEAIVPDAGLTQPEAAAMAPAPGRVGSTRRVGDRLCLQGFGDNSAQLMFVATSVCEEETRESRQMSLTGSMVTMKPRMMRGPQAVILQDLLSSLGLSSKEYFYTALCRWLLPKAHRSRPKAQDIAWGMPALKSDINVVKPRIIVTFGKPAFDALSTVRLPARDLEGGWFDCNLGPEYKLYPMPDLYQLVSKPSSMEKFRIDLAEVVQMLREMQGFEMVRVPLNYQVIRDSAQLREWAGRMIRECRVVQAVDCEWHGNTHIDGHLRSAQFSWAPGEAVYIRFRDEHDTYVFDVDYREAGSIMAEYLGLPYVRLVGHQISADIPWLEHVLGLDTYGKTLLDTAFAQQVINEHASSSLERIAMARTDLGRYDLPLVMWRKENPHLVKDGYGFIPDDILIPYACKDVDVVIRVFPQMLEDLRRDELIAYYGEFVNGMVSDVFGVFTTRGMPVSRSKFDDLRVVFKFAHARMEASFRESLAAEARTLLESAGVAGFIVEAAENELASGEEGAMCACLRATGFGDFVDHMAAIPAFSLDSSEDMRRWLFSVKKFTPVKSTANKERGVPAIDWAKVMTYKEAERVSFKPSADKQTLQILADTHDDDMLRRVMEMKAVNSLRKTFLGEPDIDEETGEVVAETGMPYWIASDGRIHGHFSTTETNRPRSWRPNLYNWPKHVATKIMAAVSRVVEECVAAGQELPEELLKYVDTSKGTPKVRLPSIRSCVQAEPGWCFVESDYKTAEIRALAFKAGDANLIRIMTEPDVQFTIWAGDGKTKVRLSYSDDCGIPQSARDPSFIMTRLQDGARVAVDDNELLRRSDGSLEPVASDLHWGLAETSNGLPRESMDEDTDRHGAKTGNFSSLYGATAPTLERKIRADTGITPKPGTGQKILDGLYKRQPVAMAYLDEVEQYPRHPGFMRATSGRKRRFVLPDTWAGVSSRIYDSLASSQGREARNFPMQNVVADTSSRAAQWLLGMAKKENLRGWPVALLYDSLVTYCPIEERHVWAKAHELFMVHANTWVDHGRRWNFPIDTDINLEWSTKPTGAAKAALTAPPTEEESAKYAEIVRRLDDQIQKEKAAMG